MAVLEIGRYSVSPWTIPRTMAWTASTAARKTQIQTAPPDTGDHAPRRRQPARLVVGMSEVRLARLPVSAPGRRRPDTKEIGDEVQLLIHDNPDTRDVFLGEGGQELRAGDGRTDGRADRVRRACGR